MRGWLADRSTKIVTELMSLCVCVCLSVLLPSLFSASSPLFPTRVPPPPCPFLDPSPPQDPCGLPAAPGHRGHGAAARA